MASKLHSAILLTALAGMTPTVLAQDHLPPNGIKFEMRDGPIQLVSEDDGASMVTARAGSLLIDLHILAKLRNQSGDTVRGITLLVLAQEATPGGKMSSSLASTNVGPGENFDMRINARLLRPAQSGPGPLVRVMVDGVLFKNYDFYGPDRLNSHRQMLAWELQAERDRKYFKQVLQSKGVASLQTEMLDSLSRQVDRPQLDVQLARGGRATTSAAVPDRREEFTFLQFPNSPIQPMNGWADITRNEAHAPEIEIHNTSSKNVRYVEIAWLVRDMQDREYLAGSVPASDGELYLPPGRKARLLQDASLRFSRDGRPVAIKNMTGFVSEVEYSDHNIWIPERKSLQDSHMLSIIPPSPEEQRLSDLYHREGIQALVRELSKFQ